MCVAGDDLDDGVAAERNRQRGQFVRVTAEVVGVAEAELAEVVATPAVHRLVRKGDADVAAADRGLVDTFAKADAGGRELTRLVAEAVGVSAAELAVRVGAPAAQPAICENHTGHGIAAYDLGDVLVERDVDGREFAAILAALLEDGAPELAVGATAATPSNCSSVRRGGGLVGLLAEGEARILLVARTRPRERERAEDLRHRAWTSRVPGVSG